MKRSVHAGPDALGHSARRPDDDPRPQYASRSPVAELAWFVLLAWLA
jgi:hypothetical protein